MSYEVVGILDSVLGRHKSFGKGEHYYYCPFCNHYNPKLAVNITKRKWQCWKCGARGATLLSLLRKINVSREQIAELKNVLGDEVARYKQEDEGTEIKLTLPAEFVPLIDSPQTMKAAHARRYLLQRGYTDADILRYQIGYCEAGRYQNRVIVPSYDETGSLSFFVGRDFYGTSSLNYLIPPVSKNVIGFGNLLNWNHPIVITEGVFDAMAVKRNGIPLFGKTIPRKLKTKIIQTGIKEIYLALDLDALKETVHIAEELMNEGINVFVVELDGKDPSDLGFDQMQALLRKTTPLTFMDLMQLKLKLVTI